MIIRLFTVLVFCISAICPPVIQGQVSNNLENKRNVSIQFDNDTYYLTDYYYTYGLTIGFGNQVFKMSPWKAVFPKFKQNSLDLSQLSLSQKLYTPKNIRDTTIQFNDRPFAATLELEQIYQSYDSIRKVFIVSAIRLGILGPAAGGELFQKKIHEWINSPDPNGWNYQIQNTLILNYDFKLSYPLYNKKTIRISGEGIVRVGTLNDDLELGLNLHAGKPSPVSNRRYGGWIRAYGSGRLIAHNSTLQGGFFSNNPYSLSYNEISQVVFKGIIELGLYYKDISLCYSHTYLSKEFDAGVDHNYGSFKLVIGF